MTTGKVICFRTGEELNPCTLKQTLIDYLENVVNFRDYTIHPRSQFMKINEVAVHQIVNRETLEHDVDHALYNFHRDGFGCVVFYI